MEQRLIDANALKKAVNGRSTHWLNDWSTLGVLAVIDEQPTIDAVPVVHGRFEVTGMFDDFLKCSVCGRSAPWTTEKYNYCPNCGAKMDGKEK